MYLAIRQNLDDTEFTLVDPSSGEALCQETWHSGRSLMEGILPHIEEFTSEDSVDGYIVHRGPGGFTAQRILCSTMNTLAWCRGVRLVGVEGEIDATNWWADGAKKLQDGQDDKLVMPVYIARPNITTPRK